jgi:hypothetical protein
VLSWLDGVTTSPSEKLKKNRLRERLRLQVGRIQTDTQQKHRNAPSERRQAPGWRWPPLKKSGILIAIVKALLSHLAVLLGFSATVFGNQITLTYSGFATGTLGPTSFTDKPFTVTSGGDTSSVFVTGGSIYELPAVNASIDIAGFSSAVFTDSTSWTDPQGAGDVIFNDATLDAGLLGMTKLFAGLETYQFQTSIGPISGGFPFDPNIFETFQDIPTSDGLLSITMTSENSFTAVVTPEPASPWLALAGLGAAVLLSKGNVLRLLRTR